MLEVDNLRVAYNRVIQVINGISFAVPTGSIVVLLGANGAGKSTTLKAISGMLRSDNGLITDGRVILEGNPVTGFSANRMVLRGVVHVMEGRVVFPDLTVKENLHMGAFGARHKSVMKSDIERCINYFPRLGDRLNTQAGYLSGGEQQMLVIGRALMAHPRLMLLDEPSMGLSPLLVQEVFRIIEEIRKSEKLSILLVEQNVKLALKIADHGYVIERGLIKLAGPAGDLRQDENLQKFYLGIGETGSAPGEVRQGL